MPVRYSNATSLGGFMSPQMLDLDNSINCVCICDDVTGCCHGSGSNQGGRGPRASKDGSSGSSEVFLERSEALKKAAAAKKKKSTLCNPPPLVNSCQLGVAHSCLYSGSKFGGFQTSKGNSYQVEVVFQNVDQANSYLCGYLMIKGLTEEYPTMTTFFDGEIISAKNPFLTRKWEADEEIDRRSGATDFVFMRWKERFLLPDHTVKDIHGASFAGFYYICFTKSKATIEGYYYHRQSEWYQTLNLTHIPENSISIYEFR
ncbi:GID complex subunit 4, VID24 [Tyrophagus putrescentiae]|nr:GID complex subunit 4, VID24 [Tyrophagus putrescentiae]